MCLRTENELQNCAEQTTEEGSEGEFHPSALLKICAPHRLGRHHYVGADREGGRSFYSSALLKICSPCRFGQGPLR